MYNVKSSDRYREKNNNNKKQKLSHEEEVTGHLTNGHASEHDEKHNNVTGSDSNRSGSHDAGDVCGQLSLLQSDGEATTFYIESGTTPFGLDSEGNFTVGKTENSSLAEKYGVLMANKKSELFVLHSSRVSLHSSNH